MQSKTTWEIICETAREIEKIQPDLVEIFRVFVSKAKNKGEVIEVCNTHLQELWGKESQKFKTKKIPDQVNYPRLKKWIKKDVHEI